MKIDAQPGSISARLPTPLYHQIYVFLREKIADGTYPDGSYLPGEHQVAGTFGVSRITAKRAMELLAAEGIVVRQRGRGTRVQRRPTSFEGSVDSLRKSLQVLGQTKIRVLSFGHIAAPPEVATALGLERSAAVQRSMLVRSTRSNLPFSVVTAFVPVHLTGGYSARDLVREPLFNLLERSGVKVTRAEQQFFATLADQFSAEHLEVNIGAPLLKVVRVVYDSAERPVEYLSALFRSDRYQYRVDLMRDADSASWR